jgi:AraC-like DNA-binding protein
MKQNIVVMHKNVDFLEKLQFHLPHDMHIVEKKSMRTLQQEVRINPVSCVVLHVEQSIPDEPYFERFKRGFPDIPCVAVLVPQNMELARHCGAMGIESVLPYHEIDRIGDEITRICALKDNKVDLKNISIGKESPEFSAIIRESLSIMERDYAKILHTHEVSDLMEITEETLSREFAKYKLPGPKKILMQLKVKHAVKLMRNEGLNIREISSLSGFTDEKRMAECFHRMFGMPPGEYRLKKN